jgi:hypothetical protein
MPFSLKSMGVNVNFSPVVDIYDSESDHYDVFFDIHHLYGSLNAESILLESEERLKNMYQFLE